MVIFSGDLSVGNACSGWGAGVISPRRRDLLVGCGFLCREAHPLQSCYLACVCIGGMRLPFLCYLWVCRLITICRLVTIAEASELVVFNLNDLS